MAKLYDKNFKKEDIMSVEPGDVIVYESSNFLDNYLVVSAVDIAGREISGQLASRVGVNTISIDNIIEAQDF